MMMNLTPKQFIEDKTHTHQQTGWTPFDSLGAGSSSVYSSPTLTNRKDPITLDRYDICWFLRLNKVVKDTTCKNHSSMPQYIAQTAPYFS